MRAPLTGGGGLKIPMSLGVALGRKDVVGQRILQSIALPGSDLDDHNGSLRLVPNIMLVCECALC